MAKEMKRVLRENTTVDTKQAKFLSEKLRCSSQKSLASSSFLLRLPWRIHQERWSFSFAE